MTDAKLKSIIEYYDDGKIKYAYSVDENGNKQGPSEAYHENGRLEIKCTYKDGEYNGQYEEYWHNGQLTKKCTYKDGYEDGSCEKYQPNGRLWGKCTYKDGKEDGPYEAYHDNGQLREKGVYKMGVELKGKEAEEYLKEWEEKRIMAQKTCKRLNARLVQINEQMAPTQLRQAVKRAEVAKFRKIHSYKHAGRIIEKKNWFQKLFRLGR